MPFDWIRFDCTRFGTIGLYSIWLDRIPFYAIGFGSIWCDWLWLDCIRMYCIRFDSKASLSGAKNKTTSESPVSASASPSQVSFTKIIVNNESKYMIDFKIIVHKLTIYAIDFNQNIVKMLVLCSRQKCHISWRWKSGWASGVAKYEFSAPFSKFFVRKWWCTTGVITVMCERLHYCAPDNCHPYLDSPHKSVAYSQI